MCVGTFALSTSEMPIVSVTVSDLATFSEWVTNGSAVKETSPDLGDAACFGPASAEVPTVLIFRKGNRAVRLVSTKKDDSGERLVSDDQLLEFAKLIASRM